MAEPLGGGALAQLAIENAATEWFEPRPTSAQAWRDRVVSVGSRPAGLEPAMGGGARLFREACDNRGVVVTTGQQPGLFGGPLYTLHKALTALELARELQDVTGVPVVPVFWAATDDADFAEASSTWVRSQDGAHRLSMSQEASDGVPMSDVPLEDVGQQVAALLGAASSAQDLRPLELVRQSYRPGKTVGGAFVRLLRGLFEPLGVVVLDASHPAVVDAARAMLTRALEKADHVHEQLALRDAALTRAGFTPQVASVDALSLVFRRGEGGRKLRVPRTDARGIAADAASNLLTPNVLLRPVIERVLLPTVAYIAGPGELSYFAQATAVADALGLPRPLAVPRWSATILEPDVLRSLNRHEIGWRELGQHHDTEKRLARAAAPSPLLAALAEWRQRLDRDGADLKALLESHPAPLDPRVVDGATRGMRFRIDRLERRLLAGVKRKEAAMMRDVAALRGALFPGGMRQERSLNFVPLLAANGSALVDAMRASARRHARAIVHATALPYDE